MLGEQAAVYLHACVDGLGKAVLLALDNAGYILLLFAQLGVLALVFMYNGVYNAVKEGLVNAQKLSVARSSSQKSAQNIASSLV